MREGQFEAIATIITFSCEVRQKKRRKKGEIKYLPHMLVVKQMLMLTSASLSRFLAKVWTHFPEGHRPPNVTFLVKSTVVLSDPVHQCTQT